MNILARGYNRRTWLLVLLLLVGIVIGGFLGELLGGYIPILKYGYHIEVTPHTWNLGIFKLTFGLGIKLNMFGVLGIIASIFIYRKM